MPEFSSLELFVEVARCRSFSRAADRAGVSQSAASQRVSHLEKALGVQLLDRSHRPLSLTDAGQLLLDEGGPLVTAYRALADRVATLGQPANHLAAHAQPDRPIRVRGIYSTGIDWLGRVARLWASSPTPDADAPAPWNLDFASHEFVRDALLHGHADLGIVSYPAGLPTAWAQATPPQLADEAASHPGRWAWAPLRDEPLALVCPPNHRLTREPAVAARHLQRDALLMLDAKLPLGRAIADYLEEHAGGGTSAATSGGGFDNLDTLKSAILATGTPAILPQRCVADELNTGRLLAVTLRPAIARPLAVAWREPIAAATGTRQAAAFKRHASPPPAHLADAISFLQQHAHEPASDRRAAAMPFPKRVALNATA